MAARLVCCVTDRRRFGLSSAALIDCVRWAADAGADLIQVRERDLTDRALADLVRALVAATADSSARVLVNDRVDVALAAGAAGVHLRADSLPASAVRSLALPPFVVGRSIHSLTEAHLAAAQGGCDYLVFGTVFPSRGKPDGHPVAGVAALRAVCRSVDVPVLAIGGIDAARARDAAAAGAAGVAGVELFMTAATGSAMRQRLDGLRRELEDGGVGSVPGGDSKEAR